MADGDALLRRYEVCDSETGETVEDAFVLRPSEDDVAQTVMHVYGGLCGLDSGLLRSFVRQGPPLPDDLMHRAIRSQMEPPPKNSMGISSASNPFDAPFDWADGWVNTHPEVRTVEKLVVAASRAIGFDPVKVVYRTIPEEKADYWMRVIRRLRRMKGVSYPRRAA